MPSWRQNWLVEQHTPEVGSDGFVMQQSPFCSPNFGQHAGPVTPPPPGSRGQVMKRGAHEQDAPNGRQMEAQVPPTQSDPDGQLPQLGVPPHPSLSVPQVLP
jgi:hypothetical protein